MAAAQTMSYKELYKNYLFYQLIGGAPQIMLIIGSIIFFVIQNKQNTIENIQWKDFIVVMVLT